MTSSASAPSSRRAATSFALARTARCRRQKHPFFAPPATVTPGTRLYQLTQDTLRSSLASVPFYDPGAVVALLDRLPAMDAAARSALDPVIFSILSIVQLQKGFRLAA